MLALSTEITVCKNLPILPISSLSLLSPFDFLHSALRFMLTSRLTFFACSLFSSLTCQHLLALLLLLILLCKLNNAEFDIEGLGFVFIAIAVTVCLGHHPNDDLLACQLAGGFLVESLFDVGHRFAAERCLVAQISDLTIKARKKWTIGDSTSRPAR